MRLLMALLIGWSMTALGAEAIHSQLTLSLAEAEKLWSEHNRELKLARTAVVGAEADVVSAGQAPNPQVSLNVASISPQEGVGNGGLRDKRMDSILRVDQLIERGNKRDLRSKAAEALLKASRSDLDDARRQQRLVLWAAYYDLLLAQEKKKIAAETVFLYGKSLAASEIRLKVGDISGTDVSRLRIDMQRAENDARQAVADLEKTQVALAYLIGKEQEARTLQVADSWPQPNAATESAVDLVARRPDVKAAQARVDAAEKARDLARALKTRDVTVSVQMEHNLQNSPTNSFGVGVSVPLFVRYGYEGEIARAEADLQSAREQFGRTFALAQGSIDQARADLSASLERRQRLDGGMLADAERVARAAEFAYAKGAMSLMDLLDARRTWRQVQLEAVIARTDHAKATTAWRAALAE